MISLLIHPSHKHLGETLRIILNLFIESGVTIQVNNWKNTV